MEILQFGDSPNLDLQEACVEAAIKFVFLLHDNKSKDADINGRHSFPRKVEKLKIAANHDVLTLHSRRAACLCYIWKNGYENFGSLISCRKLLGYH